MKRHRLPIALVLIAYMLPAVAPALGQDSPKAGSVPVRKKPARHAEDKPLTVTSFRLQNMQAETANTIILDLYRDQLSESSAFVQPGMLSTAVDQRSNAVVVRSSNEIVQAIGAILMRLDDAKQQSRSQSNIRVFPLKRAPANDAAAALMVLGVSRRSVHVDHRTNTLITKATGQELAEIEELIRVIDRTESTPLEGVYIRFVWLVESALATEVAQPVPDDLDESIVMLSERLGLGEMRMAAQILINANHGDSGSFNSGGSAVLRGSTVIPGSVVLPQHCSIEVSGQLAMRDAQAAVLELEIEAKKKDLESRLCALRTTISLPPDHPVILGMTPIDSKASLFVVQIMKK
jgi:type II secretory pathway component GspD/PulD (secretin)